MIGKQCQADAGGDRHRGRTQGQGARDRRLQLACDRRGVLGSGEVTLQSITAAYAAFANQGRVQTPIVIRRVEDRDGRVLFKAEETSARAISETTAFLIQHDGRRHRSGTAGCEAGGLQASAAARPATSASTTWFIGCSELVTGVWVGSISRERSAERLCRRCRRSLLDGVHEGGDAHDAPV
jgi:membrane peptidoglycan carboxypeptidase